ncbi:hypothetical protein scyTo_0022956, partial [Scyliorhinus torazame]|nr:hypothetical protein [Scyliorhinus torazame]
ILLLGQGLSMLLCGTAISSQYLADEFAVNTPVLQGFINYVLLFLVYTGILMFRRGNDNLLQILKTKWWKYLLLGLIDVEANYLVVKAYQYTTLTSVQVCVQPYEPDYDSCCILYFPMHKWEEFSK